MPLIHCSFYSECLEMPANIVVILPQAENMSYCQTFPVVYLLHGLMDDYDSWQRRTSLERYCTEYGLAAVLPHAGRSFYTDMKYGYAYYTHISREVPAFCEAVFPIGRTPDNRFIAGNSMGGYGALKIALKNPGFFAKAASLSGVVDINSMIRAFPQYENDWNCCFGQSQAPDAEDLFFLISKAQKSGGLLPLLLYCGTEDFLYEDNRNFFAHCCSENISADFREIPKAIHEWNYWDLWLPNVFQWFKEVSI